MKLKAYHSILIFAILVMSAAFSSVSNYRKAQYAIVQDMNKALALTLQENKYQWITPDTIQSYRSHLSIDLLKSTSNLCYVMEDRRRGKNNSQLVNSANLLSSKQMLLNEHSIQSYANCSMADVLSMSNQRTSLTLTLMAMIWAIARYTIIAENNPGIMRLICSAPCAILKTRIPSTIRKADKPSSLLRCSTS